MHMLLLRGYALKALNYYVQAFLKLRTHVEI